jgi:hypothetical protein
VGRFSKILPNRNFSEGLSWWVTTSLKVGYTKEILAGAQNCSGKVIITIQPKILAADRLLIGGNENRKT